MLEHHSDRLESSLNPMSGPARFIGTARLPRIPSNQLLQGGRDVLIEHNGQEYRLRLTRNDKLILTK